MHEHDGDGDFFYLIVLFFPRREGEIYVRMCTKILMSMCLCMCICLVVCAGVSIRPMHAKERDLQIYLAVTLSETTIDFRLPCL